MPGADRNDFRIRLIFDLQEFPLGRVNRPCSHSGRLEFEVEHGERPAGSPVPVLCVFDLDFLAVHVHAVFVPHVLKVEPVPVPVVVKCDDYLFAHAQVLLPERIADVKHPRLVL